MKRDPDALYGYQFHAKVIDVKTGVLKLTSTSYGKPYDTTSTHTRKVVATPRGLEIVENTDVVWPTLREVGESLALEMMDDLSLTL